MKLENFERVASEADEIRQLKPLLVQLLVEAKLPADHAVMTLTYRLLFSAHQNLDGMIECLRQRQQKRLLRFIGHKAFLSKLAEMALQWFDPRFIHNRIMKSAIDRWDVVRKLQVDAKAQREVEKPKERLSTPKTEVHERIQEIVVRDKVQTAEAKETKPRTEDIQKKTKTCFEKKPTKEKGLKPRTADSQRTYRRTRESQVLPPPRKVPKSSDPKQKLNKASILRTGATINQSLSNEERLIESLAAGYYYNPYQAQIEKQEAFNRQEQQYREIQSRKLRFCQAIRKRARRAQLLGNKRKKASVNLLKSQKMELARQWRSRCNEDIERVRLLCKSLQAAKNSQHNLLEQKREIVRTMNQDLQQKLQTTKAVWQQALAAKMCGFKTTSLDIERQRLGSDKMNDKTSSLGLLCELPLAELKGTLKQLRNQIIDQNAQRRAKKQLERNREVDKLEEMMRVIDKHKKIQEKQRMHKQNL